MVAKRDINPGEIILREPPCVFGPKITSQPMCLGCLRTVVPLHAKDYYKCSKCNWPMCGENCENSLTHVDECRVMQEKKFVSSIKNTGKPKTEVAYCVIVPLRVILLKKSNPKV